MNHHRIRTIYSFVHQERISVAYIATLETDMLSLCGIGPRSFVLTRFSLQVLCDIVLRLSDSAIIPFNVDNYSAMMVKAFERVKPDILKNLGQDNVYLLKYAISNFSNAAEKFQAMLDAENRTNLREFDVQEINDKLIRLSRAFVYDGSLLHYGQYRNVLMAPHPSNLKEAVTFPGLTLDDDDDRQGPLEDFRVARLQRELIILVVAIRRATDILLDDFGPDMPRSEF
ncbi:hypothetical protein EGW08_012323 [Elysia chlorotica]|uniref:Transferrin receptor-like dimerisation domain-containing protein n=1 Tax=Elysia chlorotica TaxID=188477 RepID=A0A433TED1_ELYCH|nr:hypothetical protein EGW08_012323 [Elysia chlorotica]